MGLDYVQDYEGVTTTFVPPAKFGKTALGGYLSAWNVTETAGSAAAASIKIRDNYAPLSAIASAADGAAGNVTVGLHMFMVVGVTKHGEMWRGSLLEFTSAGSVIVNLTGVPIVPLGDSQIVGRRIYVTKAGAPGTGVSPTTAQWFRIVADVSTTLTSANNNFYLPQASIVLTSATGLAAGGGYVLITTSNGVEPVAYTGISTNTLTGCTGGSGLMATGGAVTAPMINNNTATTYAYNTADGSVTATNPVTAPTDGKVVEFVKLGAGQSVGMEYPNPIAGVNGGGFQVQVVSGTVDVNLKGK